MLHSCGTLMKKVYYNCVYKILFILRALHRPAYSTLLIRLRFQTWTECEKWKMRVTGWDIRHKLQSCSISCVDCDQDFYSRHVCLHSDWCRVPLQLPDCLLSQLCSANISEVLSSTCQQFPDLCLSLTVLTQSQNNPENPLISQDMT